MSAARFACYLAGGTLPGMARTYPGARDRRPPSDVRGVMLPGQVYFALESAVWGGGMAFLDPDGPGQTPARAYLISADQFADVVEQEMHRAPGRTPIDLRAVLAAGRLSVGDGRYETLIAAGRIAGAPVVTFTAPELQRPFNPPSPPYVRMLAAGLEETFGWDGRAATEYLYSLPGASLDATAPGMF